METGQITGEHVGTILVGGRTLDADAIVQAAETQVRGLIVGSIPGSLLPLLEQYDLPLIASEGFGDAPMLDSVFDLLQTHAGQEVCFAPSPIAGAKSQRPEIFVYLPTESRPPRLEPGAPLAVGARVRVLRAPYQHAVGEVTSLPDLPRRLASGIRAQGAEVSLESGDQAFVPLENLEILR